MLDRRGCLDMKRVDVLNEINILMDWKCNGCKIYYELVK